MITSRVARMLGAHGAQHVGADRSDWSRAPGCRSARAACGRRSRRNGRSRRRWRPSRSSISRRIRRPAALSSQTSARKPRRLTETPLGRLAMATGSGSGSSNAKVEPRPRSLSTQMRPPIVSTRWREMLRPSPAPPPRRANDPSSCTNGRNSRPSLSAGMPMPLSRTEKRSDAFAGALDREHDLAFVGELDRVGQEVHQHLAQGAADRRRRAPARRSATCERKPSPFFCARAAMSSTALPTCSRTLKS